MILNKDNTSFTKEGALSAEDLANSEKVLIYTSSGLISSLSYSGGAEDIVKSTSIPSKFTEILKNIDGSISLGVTKRHGVSYYRNANIYNSVATTLDGINRLGYVFSIDDNTIGISEITGNRGSGYSSCYRILKKKLIENGFRQKLPYDYFNITLSDAPKFVEVINEVIQRYANNEYVLIKEEGIIDTVTLGRGTNQRKLYFNVAYWTEEVSTQENSSEMPIVPPQSVENIIANLDGMLEEVDMIKSMEDIDLVASKLKNLLEFTITKKQGIQIRQQYK